MTRLIVSLLDKIGHGPKTELDDRDDYFAILRCFLTVAGFAWLALSGSDLPSRVSLSRIIIGFSIYSVALYAALWLFRLSIRWVYHAAMLLDLAFVYGIVTRTGGLHSVFLLAFYLLAGLQSYYFGLRLGLVLAIPIAGTYALIDPASLAAEFWTHHSVQLAFLGLVVVSSGIFSDREKEDSRIRGELIAKLGDFRRMLEQSERVASVGRLAGGIAHHINNPVAVILSRIDCMCEDLRLAGIPPRIIEDFEVLRRHTLKISETTNRLLGFARPAGLHSSEIDINSVMEECVALVQPRLESKGATLNLNLSHGLPAMLGYPNRLEEAVVNILNNAVDALDQGGQVYLITSLNGGTPGELQIVIADTGIGIPPEDLPRIFDPFYTTKDINQGTGLGLYVAHQVVEDHGGRIDVQSELGKGTIVTITFPVGASNPEAGLSG